jgi:hypothetical protein
VIPLQADALDRLVKVDFSGMLLAGRTEDHAGVVAKILSEPKTYDSIPIILFCCEMPALMLPSSF